MRLIDVDKLPATCNVAIVNGKLEVNGWIAAKRIEEAPTVEAIPTELIKKKLLSCQYEYENDYDKGFDMGWNCAIKTLLKDWKKENEMR